MDRYQQTLTALEQLIETDAVAADGRLPTERELSETFGVGRRILRRALASLEEQGRILRHQGRGTFVVGRTAPTAVPPATPDEIPAELLGLLPAAPPAIWKANAMPGMPPKSKGSGISSTLPGTAAI